MNVDEFEQAILIDDLRNWVRLGPPSGGSTDTVCVFEGDTGWQYVITDERAVVIERTRRRFPDESSALTAALEAGADLRFGLT